MIDTISLALWSSAALVLVLLSTIARRRDNGAKALRVRARYRDTSTTRR